MAERDIEITLKLRMRWIPGPDAPKWSRPTSEIVAHAAVDWLDENGLALWVPSDAKEGVEHAYELRQAQLISFKNVNAPEGDPIVSQ